METFSESPITRRVDPLPLSDFLKSRFNAESDMGAEGQVQQLVDRSGNTVSLMQWNTIQAGLAFRWHQIMVEPLIADSARHREVYQAVEDALKLDDVFEMGKHLRAHLPEDLHDYIMSFTNSGLHRIGIEMRAMCKYAGVDVDSASAQMLRHYSKMRQDAHALLHFWNEKAGEISVPLPEANEHIHETIEGMAISERERMAYLLLDIGFPNVVSGNNGPQFSVDESHTKKMLVTPTHPYWIDPSRVVRAA